MKITLELEEYEIINIQKALALVNYEHRSKLGKWEEKESGNYYYSETKISKQLSFIEKNIERQTGLKRRSLITIRDFER